MGQAFQATCKKCGHKFRVSEGGGFTFFLLHCDTCGQEKYLYEEEMGTAFKNPSERERWKADYVPPCSCGGRFTDDAPARCPKCRGCDFDHSDGCITMYD